MSEDGVYLGGVCAKGKANGQGGAHGEQKSKFGPEITDSLSQNSGQHVIRAR